MMIDGVKMACEACIRGHRVSGCNHHDRKLLPIAKKGRPVSQCTHCRHMRKSRAAHVKCDCGERTAAMKEQAKNGGKPAAGAGSQLGGLPVSSESGDSKSGTAQCQCCYGGRCTCALKKDPQSLDSVPELSAPVPASAAPTPEVRSKPRLQMTHSESSLVTLANSHHRPAHRHHASFHGTVPYTIPTVGHTGHAFGEHHGAQKVDAPAGQKPRRIKSEQSSPDMRTYPALKMATTSITPLDLTPHLPAPVKPVVSRTASGRIQTGLSVNTNQPPLTVHNYSSQEFLVSADSEMQFSAGLFAPQSAGWPPSFSHYEGTSFEDALTVGTPQYASSIELEAFMGQRGPAALANPASGEDTEESGLSNGPTPPVLEYGNGILSSDSSDLAESDYGPSAASSFVGLPQLGMPGSNELGEARALTSSMPLPASTAGTLGTFGGLIAGSDDAYLGAFGFTADDNVGGQFALGTKPIEPPPTVSPDEDLLWMAPYTPQPPFA